MEPRSTQRALSGQPLSSWQSTVTRHFQRAATTYANVSELQQASMNDLLAECRAQGLVLELGAGQCHLASAIAARLEVSSLVALDISEAMLRTAPPQAKVSRMVASALAIPLIDHSVDAIVSHFALHWCLAPAAVAAEMHRIIRRDGSVQLAIPLAGSLAPLHGEQGDGALLLPLNEWQQAFASRADSASPIPSSAWACEHDAVKTYTRHFHTASEWLSYLRAMGVTAKPKSQQSQSPQLGLAGKQGYQYLIKRLEQAAEPAGIPFTFKVWHAQFRAL
ncbi:MAG: methyltransferase domain-containing protein [Paraperlucidibaca sp.]|jgi:SAM-dependent methyltransferase|nr:methyltransferase domain-containing protein [Paraperlucidibaca sp.]MBQ0842286.1 methyltransferase domain-containing protein [Paraperlucidibaca sp.]